MSPGSEQSKRRPPEFTPELAIRLKREQPIDLFVMFARAVLNAQWSSFILCLSRICDISERGVKVMLENVDARDSWQKLYDTSNMPQPLFSAFMELLHLHPLDRQASANDPHQNLRVRESLLNRFKRDGLPEDILSELID